MSAISMNPKWVPTHEQAQMQTSAFQGRKRNVKEIRDALEPFLKKEFEAVSYSSTKGMEVYGSIEDRLGMYNWRQALKTKDEEPPARQSLKNPIGTTEFAMEITAETNVQKLLEELGPYKNNEFAMVLRDHTMTSEILVIRLTGKAIRSTVPLEKRTVIG